MPLTKAEAIDFLQQLRLLGNEFGVQLWACHCCNGLCAVPVGAGGYEDHGEADGSVIDSITISPTKITANFGPRRKDGNYIAQERIWIGEEDETHRID